MVNNNKKQLYVGYAEDAKAFYSVNSVVAFFVSVN